MFIAISNPISKSHHNSQNVTTCFTLLLHHQSSPVFIILSDQNFKNRLKNIGYAPAFQGRPFRVHYFSELVLTSPAVLGFSSFGLLFLSLGLTKNTCPGILLLHSDFSLFSFPPLCLALSLLF